MYPLEFLKYQYFDHINQSLDHLPRQQLGPFLKKAIDRFWVIVDHR